MAKEILNALDQKVLNSERFFSSLNRLMGASIGVIAIRTREFPRAQELLHQWSSLMDLELKVWTCHTGYKTYAKLPVTDDSDNGELARINPQEDMASYLKPKDIDASTLSLDAAFTMFQERQEKPEKLRDKICAVFIGLNTEALTNPGMQQYIRDHTQRAYQSEDRIIFLLEPGATIPDPIKMDVEVIDLPPPSYAELLDTLSEYGDNLKEELGVVFPTKDKEYIIQNAIGMTNQEFENSLALAQVDSLDRRKKEPDCAIGASDFVDVIKGRKLEILKNTEILELMSDANLNQIGGLDLLKDFLAKKAKTYTPAARKFGIKPPKGMLLVGPPGTAKSAIGRATGSALGIPCIKFDFSRVFGSLVGQSESRLRSAFKMIEEMAPNVVFMDEIDKMFSSDSGGDSGVSKRVLGMTLTWMQEKHDRGIPCFIVASANDVSNLPPELVRKGRFDEIFAVTFPTEEERAAIFKIHVEMRGHKLKDSQYDELARITANYVGSELESAIEEALIIDFYNDQKTVQMATIVGCLETMIPQSKAFPARIKKMKDWCEQNARPSSSTGSFEIVMEEATGPRIKPVVRPIKRKFNRIIKTGD